MTNSETVRAVIFVGLVFLGCLIRTYIRTANGEKEDEVHFWSSNFSRLQQDSSVRGPAAAERDVKRPRSTNTSSGEVSRAVSVVHAQPARFEPFLDATDEQDVACTGSIQTCNGTEVDEAYEDWAAIHHARGAVSEDAEASIDDLLQRRQVQKSMGVQSLGLETSGAQTPTIWTAHFPAAQLRPY